MTTTAEELLTEVLEQAKQREAEVPPQEETEEDVSKLKQRKPPKDGLCRRCGENKPVNRLMLCYPCWVKSELENTGWREGMPHPDWCHCEGLKDHAKKSFGN